MFANACMMQAMTRLYTNDFHKLKEMNKPISMTVAYDYPLAAAAEDAQLDAILIGDSASMVAQGNSTTVPVTLEQMIDFCRSVSRGAPNTFLIGDLPFGSYEVSAQQAVGSAIALIKHGGVNSIKLEGGDRIVKNIEAITEANVPVMGHLGITPQSSSNISGYRAIGKSELEIIGLKRDMVSVQRAGAFSILLEGVVAEIASIARNWVDIPVYGIGSGANLDGQLILSCDLLGLYPNFKPKFAKNYVSEAVNSMRLDRPNATSTRFYDIAVKCFSLYKDEVSNRKFPNFDFQYSIGESNQKLIEFARNLD
jgi:3-methyl-2-oxobutanoate hydroxymethyltransferase